MAEKKKVGFIEYHDEEYIREVMKRVEKYTDAKSSFVSLRNHDFQKLENYSVIFDMISPFNKYLAEIMKIYYLNGTYVINNPFSVTLYNKILQTHKLNEMKMPIPKSMVLPNEMADEDRDERVFVRKPDFKDILKKFEFPFVMKPYDGWGNLDVHAIRFRKDLYNAYKQNKNRIMLVQEAIVPIDYYRVFVINKKHTHFMKREPRFIEAKKYDFYDFNLLTPSLRKELERKSIRINKEMGYDMSTIEWSITEEGKAYIIDVNDAPNVADPKKAKQMDLHFPKETYEWLVNKITDMIIEKVEMDPQKRRVLLTHGFYITMSNMFSGFKLSFLNPFGFSNGFFKKK